MKAGLIAGLIVGSILFFVAMWLARSMEKKQWNEGYCCCGNPWKQFDMDSQGGRGYVCGTCNRYIWISYHGVDKRRNEEW